MAPTLEIDIETYSSEDVTLGGVYRHVQALDFEIMLFAYSIDSGPVRIIDLVNGESIPDNIIAMMADQAVLKIAHGASFEFPCLTTAGYETNIESWQCTLTLAAMLGLPLSLDKVGQVLKLPLMKDSAGKALIQYFCKPCKPTAANGFRNRNLPKHNPKKWTAFKQYCIRDVEVEKLIYKYAESFKMPEQEKKYYVLDHIINSRGTRADKLLIANAIELDFTNTAILQDVAKKLTGLDNPNSPDQIKKWIKEKTGVTVKSLNKEVLPTVIKQCDNADVLKLLKIRQELAKTSISKYSAMDRYICEDDRIRGMHMFYGAGRTGRWAGRGVQPHNMVKNKLKDLRLARDLVKAKRTEDIHLLFGSLSDTLSQLTRTAFIPSLGHRFIIPDCSQIEARIIAWLAGEKWRLEVFRTHGKIYEASASKMFNIPLDKITSADRAKGKVAELSLGFQGAVGALIRMGALKGKNPLREKDLPKIVSAWRRNNPKIVQLWKDIHEKCYDAIETGSTTRHGNIKFYMRKKVLFIELPSGRPLCYHNTRIADGVIVYEGTDQFSKKWVTIETYGGKLVENIVQAIGRDILAHSMLRLHRAGYNIVMHVHDEIILDMLKGVGSIDEVNGIMGKPISWALGLPLAAASFESDYYKKDD